MLKDALVNRVAQAFEALFGVEKVGQLETGHWDAELGNASLGSGFDPEVIRSRADEESVKVLVDLRE